MSCMPGRPTFRLLDHLVGWDPEPSWGSDAWRGLVGLTEAGGVRLTGDEAGVLVAGAASRWLPSPRIAQGCAPCDTWLATSTGLRLRSACGPCFETVWAGVVPGAPPTELIAVAAAGARVAVLEADGTVWVLLAANLQVLARFSVPGARILAFDRRQQLLIALDDGTVGAWGPDGDLRDPAHRTLPPGSPIAILADDDERVWLLVDRNGRQHLLVSDTRASAWEPGALSDLTREGLDQRVTRVDDSGFCLVDPADPTETATCWDWGGCPLADGAGGTAPRGQRLGQLITGPIDSGVRRCEWHRLRVFATVPPRTTLEIAVASAEVPHQVPTLAEAEATPAAPPWQGFPQGPPHPSDWQLVRAAEGEDPIDVLIRQPVGRYLYVRVRMSSETDATPVLRQIRLDMPRVTSAVHLPAVYAEDPTAWDFTRRFLAIYDAQLERFDAAIADFPALLDVGTTPPELLPWLARFFDIGLDDRWSAQERRALLAAAPELFRTRGTPHGLARTLVLAFPSEVWETAAPMIREHGLDRPWGSVGLSARLGSIRLFGRAKARIRLGGSPLGGTPLHSLGDPDRDPLDSGAHRFDVVLPLLPGWEPETLRQSAQALVDAVAPAHTVGTVRVGGSAFTVGSQSAVGIDTVSTAPPAAVVGGVRLGRSGVLGRRLAGPDWRVGGGLTGVHTVVE